MSLFDALLGTAPQIQLGNQAGAYGVQGLDFSSPYYQNLRNSSQLQGQQAAFLQAMQQQTQGIGPGQAMADALYRQQVQEGQANIAGQLAANRALNPAARAFLASQAAGKVGANAAAGAAANRAQQQIAAQGMLGSSLGQFRGQDLSAASMAQQGQLAQEGLRAGAFNAAQNLNAEIGMRQAGMQQTANQNAVQAWGGIANGLGGGIAKFAGLAHGGMVDSPSNDIVPEMLSPGEVVIPRSIAQGPDAPSHAAAFMQGVLAQEQARAKALHGHFGFSDGGPVETPRVWPSERERLAGVTDAEVEAQNAQAAADEAARTAEIAKQRAYTQWAQTGQGPKPDRSTAAPSTSDAGLLAPMTPAFKAQALTGQVPSSSNPPAQEHAGLAPGAAPTDVSAAPADRQTRLAQGFEAASESPVERAVRENSEIEARTADKTAQTYENQIAQRDAALAQRKQEVEKNLADYKRIAETAPDPHKWWSEQSTGGKIATGIGLMLSSIGSGITGQPNVAMQVIDDAIKRDITLQQSKKDSLLAHFEREGKTREEAFALSQSVALQKTADQMQALAARATSQQAASNLILLSRQMAMQSQQLQMGIAEKSAEIGLKRAEAYKAGSEAQKTGMEARKMGLEMGALKALTSGQATDRQTLNWLPAEYRERVAEVTLPDGKRHMGLVATPKMREELDTQSVAYNNFKDIWKEATEFARQHPGGELPSDAAIHGDEIRRNLVMRLAEVNKAKFSNLSKTDQELIEDLTANLSKVVDWRNNMRNLNDMKARVDRAWANDLHQAFGTKPSTPSASRKYE